MPPHMQSPDLSQISERSLNLLATVVAERPVRVVLSRRLTQPIVITYQTPTLFLSPTECGVGDLLVGARLARRRSHFNAGDKAQPVPEFAVIAWLKECRAHVQRRFPGAQRYAGRLLHAPIAKDMLPVLTWNRVDFAEATAADLAQHGASRGVELLDLSDLDVKGALSDAILIEGLNRRHLRPRQLPGLEHISYVEMPLKIPVALGYPDDWEQIENELQSLEANARGIERCTYQRSMGEADEPWNERRRMTGVRLDSARLAESVVAQMAGASPKAFRARPDRLINVFNPHEHLMIFGIDAHALRRPAADNKAVSRFMVSMLLRAYERLGVDIHVVVFHDRFVFPAPNTAIYVHHPTVVKRVDQPIDGAVWQRFLRAIYLTRDLEIRFASAMPLHINEMLKIARDGYRREPYRFIDFTYVSSSGLGAPFDHTAAMLSQTANYTDDALKAFASEAVGTEFATFMLGIHPARSHARRKGYVSSFWFPE